MDRLQRIYKLHQAISTRRHPVSCQTLQDELECSRATVNRIMQEMRLHFNAPIEYDRQRNGYHYALGDGQAFELPGLWFSATELYALLATQQLLTHVQPGLLDTQLKPVKERIEQILAARHMGSEEIARRVRILRIALRFRQAQPPATPQTTHRACLPSWQKNPNRRKAPAPENIGQATHSASAGRNICL